MGRRQVAKRLSYGWTAVVFGGLAFPLLSLCLWLQWKLSLPNWLLVILLFLCLGVVIEIQHRFGPEGAFQPFLIPSSFSTKDKVVYWLSNIVTILSLTVFTEFWGKVNIGIKIIICITILVCLLNIPVRLFGSQELKQILIRKRK
jgi:hypothetical protein